MIWLGITLVVSGLVNIALVVSTVALRKWNRTQRLDLTRLVEANAVLSKSVEEQMKVLDEANAELQTRDRATASWRKVCGLKNEQIWTLQEQAQQSASLMMQAHAELLDLRAELALVRERELPVLADIRAGVPGAVSGPGPVE